MPINGFLYPGASGPPTPYEVANSLRFSGSGSDDYLNRSLSSNGNRKIWTCSAWTKRVELGRIQVIMFAGPNGTDSYPMYFRNDDRINSAYYADGGFVYRLETNAVFRDVGAWMHIVVAFDSTQSTASNRVKMYVNGTQITSFKTASYPSLNAEYSWNNSSYNHRIGYQTTHNDFDYHGYLAEVVHIDGQALDQTSFGEFDEKSPNIWKPVDVSGLTFGTNGFYLDFEDSSALGNDVSGNNNDFSVNNLAAVDQSTDTCTNNFATLNPLYKQDHAFSDGNLTHTSSSADWDSGVSTIAASSGKYYFEAKVTAIEPPTRTMLGVGDVRDANEIAEDQFGLTNYNNGDTVAYYGSDGSVYKNGSQQSGSWSSFTTNDIVGMYVDLDNGKVYFHKNGTMQNSGDPTSGSTGTGAISITTGQTYVFGVTHYGGGAGQINFGSPPFSISSGNADPNGYGNFEYDPQGYYALNTKNLAEFG